MRPLPAVYRSTTGLLMNWYAFVHFVFADKVSRVALAVGSLSTQRKVVNYHCSM